MKPRELARRLAKADGPYEMYTVLDKAGDAARRELRRWLQRAVDFEDRQLQLLDEHAGVSAGRGS
ncbi:MAG: hypothetical protein ABR581_05060 [Thermoleophilaceae bacterium]